MKTRLYIFKSAGSIGGRGHWEWTVDYRCSSADSVTRYGVRGTQINVCSHYSSVSLFCPLRRGGTTPGTQRSKVWTNIFIYVCVYSGD